MTQNPLTEQEYDDFLEKKLFSRIKRVGPYSYSKVTAHLCQQPECQRDWKPIPKEIVETNRNYCPSCVMSWSNRVKDSLDGENGPKILKIGKFLF
jgi:hypothetical protein